MITFIFMLQTHSNRSYFYKMIHEMTDDYEKNISATEYMILSPCKGKKPCFIGCLTIMNIIEMWNISTTKLKIYYIVISITALKEINSENTFSSKFLV